MKETAPYGTWKSPISAQMVAEGALRFGDIALHDGTAYWLEGRSSEGGRVALMSFNESEREQELLPKEYSVRSKVHEYGGGALLVTKLGIFFVNAKDQQIYHRAPDGTVKQVTNQPDARYADGCISLKGDSLYYVMETHGKEVINTIVKISLTDGTVTTVASGADFYASPRVSPDGTKLAYVHWNHPNLPWDGTELSVLDLESGNTNLVAGGLTESIVDPQWSSEGELYYVSDRSNWWNVYREGETQSRWKLDAELALPHWVFGRSLYGFNNDGIIASPVINAMSAFMRFLPENTIETLEFPYSIIRTLAVEGDQVLMIVSSACEPNSVVLWDVQTHNLKVLRRANSITVEENYISQPVAIEFKTSDNRTAHGFYYAPTNPDYSAPQGTQPPLIVLSHGGPTGHVAPGLSTSILYWTSRGYAVIDVNYGGSTGYGREYRDRLKGMWGIVDVDDCTNAALHCVKAGLADANRLAIAGGSAGGFTTLAALAFKEVFHVGANYYGVSDLEALARDTHKFEARYLDQLVGQYPQEQAVYKKRSPIHSIDRITAPIIILQGNEDAVVPPSQSEMMYQSLLERKIPTAYLLFEGEQHGFRKAETTKRALEAQLYFFSRVFGLQVEQGIEPVELHNLG